MELGHVCHRIRYHENDVTYFIYHAQRRRKARGLQGGIARRPSEDPSRTKETQWAPIYAEHVQERPRETV